MKAAICPKYGPPEVLKIEEVERPVPKDNEVRIEIHASAVTASDIYIRGSQIPIQYWIPMRIALGLFKPRKSIIGLVFSGEIERVGKDIKRFKKGDQVYGMTGFSLGAYAEYVCLKENDSMHGCLALKPSSVSHEEATFFLYGGLLAFQYLERGNIKPNQKVLIYGASGTTGTVAVQYAKSMGAHVTAVCSTSNLEMVKSLGADCVLDYTKEDRVPTGMSFDFMLDAVGRMKTSKLKVACRNVLIDKNKYVSIDDGDLKMDSNRLAKIANIVEIGQFKSIIDKVYSLDDIVEAHRYVEKGHKKGGVVIKIK